MDEGGEERRRGGKWTGSSSRDFSRELIPQTVAVTAHHRRGGEGLEVFKTPVVGMRKWP